MKERETDKHFVINDGTIAAKLLDGSGGYVVFDNASVIEAALAILKNDDEDVRAYMNPETYGYYRSARDIIERHYKRLNAPVGNP